MIQTTEAVWLTYASNIRAGEIGEPRRHIEAEPLPESVPVIEPAAPQVPEKVPA